MKSLAFAAVVILAACGQAAAPVAEPATGPTSTTSPTPKSPPPVGPPASPSPIPQGNVGPAAGLLFAVVEGGPSYAAQPTAVAIVGLDGYAKAKATFTPRTGPQGCMFAIPLQGVAEVIGHGVYYIDGAGVIRLLQVGRPPQLTASIVQPPTQYETWFAVNPDGSQVLAGVVTWPTLGPAASGTPCGVPVSNTKFDLELAAGGNTRVLKHSEAGSDPNALNVSLPVGWTADGAIAMVPVSLGTQNAWWGGPLHMVDASVGTLGRQVGGSDCDSASISQGGLIACTSGQYVVTVRDSAGTTLWTTQVDGFNALTLHLSPNGQALTDGSKVEVRTAGLIAMPQGFIVEGWLDDNTVIGRSQLGAGPDRGNLSWISVNDPSNIHDLGFKGDFVGTVG